MKGAVLYGPGDVQVRDVPDARTPGPGEARLRISLAGLCGTDAGEYSHGPVLTPLSVRHPITGVLGPIMLGHEFVGKIIDVGPDVDLFAPGDRVVCGAGVWCGSCRWCESGRQNLCAQYYTFGLNLDGGLAEQVTVPAKTLFPVPPAMSDENAVLAQPLAVGLHAVNRSGARSADVCVVLGAGAIGSFILAALAGRGCRAIVAADVDGHRLTVAGELGADVLVDISRESIEDVVNALTGSQGADVVFEASGVKGNPELARRLTRRGGRIQLVGLHPGENPLNLLDLALREIDISTSLAHVCPDDIPAALEILAERDLASLLVQDVVPLTDIVGAALDPLVRREALGKFLVAPGQAHSGSQV